MAESSESIVVEPVAHSKRGGSGAHRWMNCPGSLNLLDRVLSDCNKVQRDKLLRPGEAASEGTAAHEVAALCLRDERDAWEFMGMEVAADDRLFVVDQEMADGVQVYVDHVNGLVTQLAEEGARLDVEHGMQSILDEDVFGTSDAIVYCPDTRLDITDLKYGRGVVVEPDSSQNYYYAALAIEEFGIENDDVEVHMWIAQPRIPHKKGLVREHVTTAGKVREWFMTELLPAVEATRDPEALLHVGDWCRFCPVVNQCPATMSNVKELDIDRDPVTMTGEELGRFLTRLDLIVKERERFAKEAYRRSLQGENVTGWKVVRKQANRTWKEGAEARAREIYGDEAFSEPKFLSPPNLEKLPNGKAFVAEFAYTPVSGLTLAPNSDKREAVRLTGEEAFGELDDT